MINKKIVLISLILFILISSIGAISASDIKEINADDNMAIDETVSESNEINQIDEIDEIDQINEDTKIENVNNEGSSQENEIMVEDSKELKLESSNLQGSTIIVNGSARNQMNNPTIQNAIDNANAGDTIKITGTVYEHCHFIVDKPLTIISEVGTKMTPCPSNYRGSGTYGLFFINENASGTIIKGFALTNTINEYDCYGILVRGASNVQIINCTTNTTYADGIRLENTENVTINNTISKQSYVGINIVNSTKSTITKSKMMNNSVSGISIINSTKTTITNNTISNGSNTGVYVGEGAFNTTIHTNNITYNKHTGINMSSAEYVYVINNFIGFNRNGDDYTSTAGAGVYVNCNITKVEILGNYIRQNGLYGVLNDYRTRNMNADRLAETLEINNNNYYMGHTERIAYHIEYKPYAGGAYTYNSENDAYINVGEGNGNYDIDKSVIYLGYAFYIDETICGATLFKAPSTTWGSNNYRLSISELSQVRKGVYQISIVDKDGNIAKEISSIYVAFYLNKDNDKAEPQSGDVYKTVLMQNGTATAEFEGTLYKESGNVITAVFPGLYERYQNCPYGTYNVADSDIPGTYSQTKISVSNMNLVPQSGEYFTATLKDDKGNPVANEKISFKISGFSTTYTKTTDANGKAQLQINLASEKTYTITANYAGSENYNKSSAKATVTIKKQSPTITSSDMKLIPKSGEYFTISLKDANKKPIAGKKVTFTIGSSTYTKTTDANGKAQLQINLASEKTYTVTIKSPATNQYNAVNKTNKITIKAGSKAVKLSAPNAKFVPKSGKDYIVNLKDSNNNPIADKTISITLGTKTYDKITDENGNAKLQINLASEKKNNITVKFAGDDIYSSASAKATITIEKGNTNLISYDRTFINKSAQSFAVTLKDYEGNPMANKEIDFIISSKTYTKTTDANGIAQLTINLANAKNYKIISRYNGDSQNKAINKTNTITIKEGVGESYIDANLANEEIQRILDGSPEGYTAKFLGTAYNGINLIINKSQNILSEVNTVLNGKDGEAVITVNADNVNLSNLIINANSTIGEGNGILVNGSKNVNILNNTIKNILDSNKIDDYNNGSTLLPGEGINILNSSQVKIVKNNVSSFESAFYAEYSDDLNISENEFALSDYGIKYGFGNANTEIKNNSIIDNIGWYVMDVPEGPRGYGIFLNNSAVNITISQNNISNNYMGISIDANNSTGIVITSNLIADNSLEGIRFNAGYDLAENAIEPNVTDNAIYRNAEGPSMMILGEMSANPEGIYGAGQWDEELRLKIDPNWYGVNSLRTWDYDSGIVGVGTMCPRIKTTTIRFNEIASIGPNEFSITFYKNGEIASNLASFDIYATLNRNTDKETEVHFHVINGTGSFSFDDDKFLSGTNTIEISVGSLINVVDRIYQVVYSQQFEK